MHAINFKIISFFLSFVGAPLFCVIGNSLLCNQFGARPSSQQPFCLCLFCLVSLFSRFISLYFVLFRRLITDQWSHSQSDSVSHMYFLILRNGLSACFCVCFFLLFSTRKINSYAVFEICFDKYTMIVLTFRVVQFKSQLMRKTRETNWRERETNSCDF